MILVMNSSHCFVLLLGDRRVMASARISSATSRPLAVTMKGRIASRAHSFKENILEALGHSQNTASGGPSSVPRATVSPHANHDGRVHLATKKKTNSSDNLLGYSESRRGTDTLVRDVQLSLRYFEVSPLIHTLYFELSRLNHELYLEVSRLIDKLRKWHKFIST